MTPIHAMDGTLAFSAPSTPMPRQMTYLPVIARQNYNMASRMNTTITHILWCMEYEGVSTNSMSMQSYYYYVIVCVLTPGKVRVGNGQHVSQWRGPEIAQLIDVLACASEPLAITTDLTIAPPIRHSTLLLFASRALGLSFLSATKMLSSARSAASMASRGSIPSISKAVYTHR